MRVSSGTDKRITDITAAQQATAWRAVRAIAREWKLSDDELAAVFNAPTESLDEYLKQEPTSLDGSNSVYRMSYVLGIYAALRRLFPDDERAGRWLRAPNSAPMFAGRSALVFMSSGKLEDLQLVRCYLEAVCEGKS